MADGGEVSPWSIKGAYNRLTTPPPATTLTPVAPPPVEPPVAPPVAPKPQNAISQYAGMTALQRREKEAGLKDGGSMRPGQSGTVPGKGKGDKIPAKYEPGEFVVSNAMLEAEPGLAEHLHGLRTKTLAAQGKTPEQAEAGRFKGGAIRALAGVDPLEEQKRLASAPQAGVSGSWPAPTAPLDAQAAADRATASAVMSGIKDTGQRAGAAVADVASLFPRGLAKAYDTMAVRPLRAAGVEAQYASPSVTPAGSDPASLTPFYDRIRQQDEANTPAPAGAIRSLGATNPTDQRLAAGAQQLPAVTSPATVQAPALPANPAAPGGITLAGQAGTAVPNAPGVSKFVENGKTLYSNVPDNTTLMNRGAIRPQNMDAAQALSDRYQAQAAQAAEPVGGAQGATVLPDTGGYGLLDKGYQERRSAGMALNSITASKEEKAAALQALAALDRRDLNAANNANAITRQGMTDQTTRRGQDITSAGQNINAADRGAIRKLNEQRFGLDSQKAGNENTAFGFTSRAAKRIEDLQSAYEKAQPDQKSAIAEQLRVLTGKDKPAQWKALALQGATDSLGNKTEGVLAAVNEQTGEVRRLDQGQQAPLPPGMKKQVGTANGKPVYEDANGKRFQ